MADAKQFPLAIVIRGVDRVTGVMGKVQNAISGVGRVANRMTGLDKVSASTKALGASVRSLGAASGLPVLAAAGRKVGHAFKELGHTTRELFTRMGETIEKVGLLTGGMLALGGIGITEMVKGFAEFGDKIGNTSKELGISAESLQEWTFAAKTSGVEQDSLVTALERFNKNIGDAAANTGTAKDIFRALGINIRDAHHRIKSTEELLPQLADKLTKVHSAALRATIAQNLLGRSGQQLLPMLMEGSKGLEEAAAKARALGYVMSTENTEAAHKLADALDELNAGVQGVKNRIGGALAPVLEKLAKKLVAVAEKYGPAISKWADGFAEKLPARLHRMKELFEQLWNKIQPLVKGIKWMTDTFGTANVILGTITAVIAAAVIPAMIALTSAVYTLGVALLTTPVGWIILGIMAIAAQIYLLWKVFEKIRPYLKRFWTWLGDKAVAAWEVMKSAWSKVKAFFTDLWTAIKAPFIAGFKWISDKLEAAVTAWQKIKKMLTSDDAATQAAAIANDPKQSAGTRGVAATMAILSKVNPIFGATLNAVQALQKSNEQNAKAVGAAAVGQGALGAPNGQVQVKVDFDNLPKGAKVSTEKKGNADFQLNQGFAMQGAFG